MPAASTVPEPLVSPRAAALPPPLEVEEGALRGLGWMLFANVLFASMTIFARLASAEASWQTVGASRAGLGAVVAVALALRRGSALRTRRRGLSWARSLLGTGAMLSTFYALGAPDLAVGDAVTLGATAPIFLALLAGPLLGERPSRLVWVVTLVAFAGIALIAGPRLAGGVGSAAVAVGAALFSAFAMIFLRKMRAGAPGEPPESVEAIALHFAAVSFVVHVALALPTLAVPSPTTALCLVGTGLTGGVAQLAMTRAYALCEAPRLGAVSYAGTVLAQLGAVVFLHERPTATQLVGTALVIGAGVALAWSTAHAARRARAAVP